MESQEIASLIDRLEQAEERGTLLSVLCDIKKALRKTETWQSEHLLKAVFSSQAKFFNYLTSSEANNHFSEVLKLVDVVSRILVLYSLFRNGCDNVNSFLLSSLGPENLETILKSSVSASPEEERFDEAINCLISITDRLSNFLKRLVASDRSVLADWTKNYPNNLFTAVCKTLQLVYIRIQSQEDVNLKAISLLLAKGRNLDLQDTSLLNKTIRWFSQQDSSPIWDRIAQRIFTDDSHGLREYETMLAALIHETKNKKEIIRCLGYNLNRCASMRPTIRRLILQRICPYYVPHVLAEYIAEVGGAETFLALFQEIIIVWSDVAFIKFNPTEKQCYLTVCMLEFGRNVNILNLQHTWKDLSTIIITGVHMRLANSDPVIRQSGFFVGEMCSKWKGDKEPLEFDYEDTNWVQEMKRIALGTSEVEPASTELKSSTSYVETNISSLHIKPKEEDIDSDDEFEFEGDVIPEEELNFEKLKEGEDPEKSHLPPNYIGDAMEWLAEKEKYEKFDAALINLENMIRRRAIGFSDIAGKLILRLVHLEDRFHSNNFEQIRKSCLVACLVMQPELAPSLGDVLFSRNCTFSTRYLVLNCLLEAAKELSEPPKVEKVHVKETKIINNGNDWRSIVDARIKAKTRIINKKKLASVVHVNRFAPVATIFFYPLLRTTTEEHLELQGRDAPFLAKILVVAAEVLQCGSSSSSVVKMATSLSTTVWPLRFHDEKAVREAVMFCYFSIITSLSVPVFFDVFKKETNSWLEWICSVADNVDRGEEERTLAKHVASTIFENARLAQETEQVM